MIDNIIQFKMRRLYWLSVLAFLIIFGLLSIDCGVVYAGDPIRKLARGLANSTTGLVELPKEIMRETEKSGEIAGIIVGPLKGTAKAIGRTLVGIYEVATFLIPLPRRYEPVIEPEFVF